MLFSFSNVLGALISLMLGLVCLFLFRRFVYPILSARYEKAKVTQTQGRDPARVSRIIYLLSLLFLPLLGFLAGGLVFQW